MRLLVFLLATASALGGTAEWQRHFAAARDMVIAGRYSTAIPELELALAEAERAGVEDPALPNTLAYCGALDVALGRYREGETRYRRAISIYERYHPDRTTELARAMEGFGELYGKQRQWSRAQELYTRAHDVLVRAVGPEDYLVGRVLVSMGELAQELHENDKAERLYLDAAAILNRNSKRAGLDLADLNQNLAMLYLDTDRIARAGELFQSAIDAYRKVSPQHPSLAVTLKNYAEYEVSRQNYTDADNAFREALQICETSLGPDSPQMGLILESYGKFLVRTRRRKEAREVTERSREILSSSLRQTHGQDIVDRRSLIKK